MSVTTMTERSHVKDLISCVSFPWLFITLTSLFLFLSQTHLPSISTTTSFIPTSISIFPTPNTTTTHITPISSSIPNPTSTFPTPNTTTPTHTTTTISNPAAAATGLEHIVFGIAATANLWNTRKQYIKSWWRPDEMHGFAWLDRPVNPTTPSDLRLLPPLRVSSDTSHFPYSHPTGHRSAIRISRIVSETLRSKAFEGSDVRWLVMGDDDTVFVAENLVRVLNKYDHNGFYYVGTHSESHEQNVEFSFNMAFGGGGFAVSYPLAVELEKMQDRCIKRYPYLYGSDDRMHACMAELGVTLTREPGFHQMDIHGDPFGLLAAHPPAPLVSLHHLDLIDPVFPKMSRVDAINHLFRPAKLDPSALAQQSICYVGNEWTVSVSWGYAVQVMHGTVPPREMERAPRTFKNWRMSMSERWDFAFDTRASSGNTCENPSVYYMSTARREGNGTVTEYVRQHHRARKCGRRTAAGGSKTIERVVVYKEIEPSLEGTKSPRRNACRASIKKRIMKVYVSPFMDGEVIEV